MPLAGLAGGISGGPFIEYLGRKNTILFTAFPFIISWLLIALANNVIMVLAGRALSGFCVGIASLALPVYLGETVQPEVRGTLGLLPTAFGNIGESTIPFAPIHPLMHCETLYSHVSHHYFQEFCWYSLRAASWIGLSWPFWEALYPSRSCYACWLFQKHPAGMCRAVTMNAPAGPCNGCVANKPMLNQNWRVLSNRTRTLNDMPRAMD